MKRASKAICLLMMFWLALVPAYAANPTKAATQPGAKGKETSKKSAKAKTRSKAKATAKARGKSSVTRRTAPDASDISAGADPADEAALDSYVASARKVLASKPRDAESRVRLARATVLLADWILRAEAVEDSETAQRLGQKISRDLHDTGWRIMKMSQAGDAMTRQAAGFLLAHGILLRKDPDKACEEFLAAAEQLAPAGWRAAQCLMDISPDKAWEQMDRSARRGHAGAQEWMGRRCLGEFGGLEKDPACARKYLAQSAMQGRTRAQTLLAWLLADGQGGPPDIERAVTLYTAAAERGDLHAQNNLGEFHETGRGVTKNLDEALRWYERAAENGLGSAQFNAGRLLAVGIGPKRDPARARALLLQADAKGISQARQVLDWLDRQEATETRQ